MYKILLSKKAQKDRKELEKEGLWDKAEQILTEISKDPYSPPTKKLKGEAAGLYSRRLNATDRIVFSVEDSDGNEYEGIVKIIRMRTHCKGIIPLFLL